MDYWRRKYREEGMKDLERERKRYRGSEERREKNENINVF
jgi:hypothetical protein